MSQVTATSHPLSPLADALRRFGELEKLGRLPSEDAWRAMLETEAAVKATLETADTRAFPRGKNSALASSAKSGVAGWDRAAAALARAAGVPLPGGVAGMLARTSEQLRSALDGHGSVEARLTALGAGFVRTSAAGLVPPDPQDATPATGSGAGWEKPRTEPRLAQFFETVREIGLFPEDADAIISAPIPGAVRREPYVRLWFPRAEVSVFICEEVGEAMFVVPGQVTEAQCAQIGKEGLAALPGAAKIVWAGDWKARLLGALTGKLPGKKLKPKVEVTSATSLPRVSEKNGWTVDIVWPDGKTEPGRAVKKREPNIHGASGQTILKRLAAWEKSTVPEQQRWVAANVKFGGARAESGKPVTVVRNSTLRQFCHHECGGDLPLAKEKDDWIVSIQWPDGTIEPGMAVKQKMKDVCGIRGGTILDRLATWKKSGTPSQKAWLAANAKLGGTRAENGQPVSIVRHSQLRDFLEGKLPCSDPCEANGWTTLIDWPDGTIEPGRIVKKAATNIHGAIGHTILNRLAAWGKSGLWGQREWLAANVKFGGARGENGKPVTVVRASGLLGFIRNELPCSDPCEANGWATLVAWPDGKIEPGQVVMHSRSGIYGAKGRTVLDRLMAWRESGTPHQKSWVTTNVKEVFMKDGAKRPLVVVRTAELKKFVSGQLPCSDPVKANGWTTLMTWPDGEIGPGRAVTQAMPEIHGVRGQTVFKHLASWAGSRIPKQKTWVMANVKRNEVKGDAGRPVMLVRASALAWFCQQLLSKK